MVCGGINEMQEVWVYVGGICVGGCVGMNEMKAV